MNDSPDSIVAKYPIRISWYPDHYVSPEPLHEVWTGPKRIRDISEAIDKKPKGAWLEANIGKKADGSPLWSVLRIGGRNAR